MDHFLCPLYLKYKAVKVTQFFFLQQMFSMALGICLLRPHLHHSGTGGVGGPGLPRLGTLSPASGLSGEGGLADCERSSTSKSGVSDGPGDSLTDRRRMEEPCKLIMGLSSAFSSSGTSWLWMNSRRRIPLDRTRIASLRTVSSSKVCIKCWEQTNKKSFIYSLLLTSTRTRCQWEIIPSGNGKCREITVELVGN